MKAIKTACDEFKTLLQRKVHIKNVHNSQIQQIFFPHPLYEVPLPLLKNLMQEDNMHNQGDCSIELQATPR